MYKLWNSFPHTFLHKSIHTNNTQISQQFSQIIYTICTQPPSHPAIQPPSHPFLYAPFLSLFFLMPLNNLHHFLTCTLTIGPLPFSWMCSITATPYWSVALQLDVLCYSNPLLVRCPSAGCALLQQPLISDSNAIFYLLTTFSGNQLGHKTMAECIPKHASLPTTPV